MIANANISVEEAWRLSTSLPEIRQNFEHQSKLFNWAEPFQMGPFWAYWFARHVICDFWIAGESLIKEDVRAWGWYQGYIEACKNLRIFGYSINGDPDFVIDERGIILERKTPLVPKRHPTVEVTEDLGVLADRIAAKMAANRKRRKLELENDEG